MSSGPQSSRLNPAITSPVAASSTSTSTQLRRAIASATFTVSRVSGSISSVVVSSDPEISRSTVCMHVNPSNRSVARPNCVRRTDPLFPPPNSSGIFPGGQRLQSSPCPL